MRQPSGRRHNFFPIRFASHLMLSCRGVLLIWNRVGQGPTALAVDADGGCLDIFSLIYHFSFLSPSLWKTARYKMKYCLKGPLSPNQPTNQLMLSAYLLGMIFGCKHGLQLKYSSTLCLTKHISRNLHR